MTVAAIDTASAATDLALGDMETDVALGAIGMERYLRPVVHHQQLWLVGVPSDEQSIERDEASASTDNAVEAGPQSAAPPCPGFGGICLESSRMSLETRTEQRRIAELELRQAQYEASLAERRYAASVPDNRLIAAQLEKIWEVALRRVQACQARLEAVLPDPTAAAPDFAGLADALNAACEVADHVGSRRDGRRDESCRPPPHQGWNSGAGEVVIGAPYQIRATDLQSDSASVA